MEQFPDMGRWAIVIGDCIHNLRSTLDHLIYSIAVNFSGSDPPPDAERLSYPMESRQFWKLGILRHDAAFMAEFQRLQPDIRPEWKGLRLLAVLEELDNFDKHRTLNVMFAEPTTMIFGLVAPGYFPTYENVTHNFGPLEPDTEMVRIVERVPIPMNVTVEWRQSVAPVVGHTPASDGRERTGVIDLIQELSAEVAFVIKALSRFL
jgi:hypothetical protein